MNRGTGAAVAVAVAGFMAGAILSSFFILNLVLKLILFLGEDVISEISRPKEDALYGITVGSHTKHSILYKPGSKLGHNRVRRLDIRELERVHGS